MQKFCEEIGAVVPEARGGVSRLGMARFIVVAVRQQTRANKVDEDLRLLKQECTLAHQHAIAVRRKVRAPSSIALGGMMRFTHSRLRGEGA